MFNNRNNRFNRRRRRPNNSNGRRSNRGPAPARTGAMTSSRADLLVQKRVFTRGFTSIMDSSSAEALSGRNLISTSVAQFTASQVMAVAYDQYRVNCIEVFAKVFAPNISTTTDPTPAAMVAFQSTECLSAVDLDSSTPTTGDFLESYTNAKSVSLTGSFKRIGKFWPRPNPLDLGMQGLVSQPNTWLSTRSLGVEYFGLQTLIRNQVAGQFFGTTGANGMGVEYRIRCHVSFRGRRVDPGFIPTINYTSLPESDSSGLSSKQSQTPSPEHPCSKCSQLEVTGPVFPPELLSTSPVRYTEK